MPPEKIDLYTVKCENVALKAVPSFLAKRYNVLPLYIKERKLVLAVPEVLNATALEDVRLASGYEVLPLVAEESALYEAVSLKYGENKVQQLAQEPSNAQLSQAERTSEAPAVNIVEQLLAKAVEANASDIHIEPVEAGVRVRYRLDGVLRQMAQYPRSYLNLIISRIKILSDLDISEKRLPQDGRFSITQKGRKVDIRVSTLPTIGGEKAVLRILDATAMHIDLANLGFTMRNRALYEKMYAASYGLVLVTGPTGSGKSTTLYATLLKIKNPGDNVITIEDPVEYRIDGINQVAVNPKVGLTFAKGLRTILRQDPNIIMVGEIRDRETADITINAALTGHLVFSTLHTNDAAGAVARLIDMGVEPYLVCSALRGILAQRLVRRICPKCRQEYALAMDAPEREYLGVKRDEIITLTEGRGCPACNYTGYKGRIAIHEVLPLVPEMRSLIMGKAPESELLAVARKYGTTSMREDGIAKVLAGETTLTEILRVAEM